MIALIDADEVAFRCAASAENEDVWVACHRAANLVEEILIATNSDEYQLWLSGPNNFRYTIFPEYKAKRYNSYRPKWEKEVKAYLQLDWNAQYADGCEADDMLGSNQTDNSVICTQDKDLNMIKGLRYNPVKKELRVITPEEADRFFYYQMLIGDPTDGIKGVPGIGPVKANNLLEGINNVDEMYDMVAEQYSSSEEMELNGGCLWMWRKPNDIWKLRENR